MFWLQPKSFCCVFYKGISECESKLEMTCHNIKFSHLSPFDQKAGIGRAAGTDAANIVFVMDQQALHSDTCNYKAEIQDR